VPPTAFEKQQAKARELLAKAQTDLGDASEEK
jgi:hypothetical protein